jgi:hypothetical protein
MTEPAMRSLLLAIRRATAHLRIYGPTHEVTEAAFRDIADAADSLIGSAARMMITVLDRTLYVNAPRWRESPRVQRDDRRDGGKSRVDHVRGPVQTADCGELAGFSGSGRSSRGRSFSMRTHGRAST